jgi:hypothetical protein
MTVSHVNESLAIKSILTSIACGTAIDGSDPSNTIKVGHSNEHTDRQVSFALTLKEISQSVSRIKVFCEVRIFIYLLYEFSDRFEKLEV